MKRGLLQLLRDVRRDLDGDVTLAALARRAGSSPFRVHRAFRGTLGETPKQFVQRLRLEEAAGRLIGGDGSVLEIALACGFASHEVFSRAFRREFGCSPLRYRANALVGVTDAVRADHIAFSASVGPCVRLYHLSLQPSSRKSKMPLLSITRQERVEQPILLIRRRIPRTQLQGMLAECFGKLFVHCQKAGLPLAGWPLARYVSMGVGLWTVEAALPLASPAAGEGEMEAGVLPGGPVALGIHAGPYEQLPETNAAIEKWIEENGLRVAGAPWESYVTDPSEHPNPADWRTEVFWPLA